MAIRFILNTTISGHTYLAGEVYSFAASDEGNQVMLGNAVYNNQTSLATGPVVLVQSAIPFVMPSSGTMGASGALSAITSLPAVYPDAYMWFPTGALDGASSLAAWYYTQMATVSSGTVYAQTYASGTPTVPLNKVAVSGAGASYTTVTGTAVTGPNYTMAAGQMGPNGQIDIYYTEANNNSAGAKVAITLLNTTALVSNSATTTVGKAVGQSVCNAGKAAKQWTVPDISQGATAVVSSTVDTSTAQLIGLQLQLAVPTDTVQLNAYSIVLWPA